MKSKLLILMLLAGSSMFAATRFSFGIGIGAPVYGPRYGYVAAPPPIAPAYYGVRPLAPGPGYTWVNGYYYPVGSRYSWRAGYWSRPAFAGARWYGPRYYGGRYYHGYWGRR